MFDQHQHQHSKHDVLVLGCGNFGTCLADHLAFLDHRVVIYARDSATANAITEKSVNTRYLPHSTLCTALTATSTLSESLVSNMDVLLFAVPTQAMRSVLRLVQPWITAEHTLLFVNKGIETESCMLPLHIIEDVLGSPYSSKAVFLSGPSFAAEVVERKITAVAVASYSKEEAEQVQRMFHAPFFRVYISDDPIGLEVAGAFKNIIAIGAGACTGLGMDMNARAALITRGLAEITRIGVRMGGKATTFLGLCGVGDLLLTCSSEKSRNFTVGFRLGRGEAIDDILASLGSTAEGVASTKAAFMLCQKLDIECPIVTEAYRILYCKKPVLDAVQDLLLREAGHDELALFPKQ